MSSLSNFDSLFFRGYIGADTEIRRVFHRHIFSLLEDILLWAFFALFIPTFFYLQNLFWLQSALSSFQVTLYLLGIYGVMMYKFFDWYLDVWIATENNLVDLRWKFFQSTVLYTPYAKVEGIQIRTRSWWTSLLGMSDVVVKLSGMDEFTLVSAGSPNEIITYLQEMTSSPHHHEDEDDDREPFDILVDTLSGVVKWHLTTHGKDYITRAYVEKLDDTFARGKPIDLRTSEERVIVDGWKKKYIPVTHEEWGGHGDHAGGHHGHH